ncbi:MAG: hypothetical protein ACLTER_10910 [Ruminococcus sp.]
MEQVEELLADTFHIDIHLAHTWLLANHEDCIHSEVCQDAFSQISVELMRALNFYQFSIRKAAWKIFISAAVVLP